MSTQREDPWARIEEATAFSDEALCALANGADEMAVETLGLLAHCCGVADVAGAIAAAVATANRRAITSHISGSGCTLTLPNGLSYRVTVEARAGLGK